MKFIIPVFIGFFCFNGNAQGVNGSERHLASNEQNAIPPLNVEIVKAVKSNIGKKVGTGECWDLIQVVLDQVDAKWERTEKFGTKLNPKMDSLQPGDIVMLKKVQFKGVNDKGQEYTISMYNHYAFVMMAKGNLILVAHQNTDEFGRKVGMSTIYLSDLKKGTITFFRPVSN